MFIVYIGKEKHSAWNTEGEARHQIRILRDHGYENKGKDNLWIDFIEGATYPNGHYFV
jgi:hypothetical protein